MKITKLNCTACGAPMSIPEDLDQIICTACGTGLVIERGEGYVALKIAEKIARTIEVSGLQTQDVIRENTQVTRAELQRLQFSQELSALQMQLNGIQTEIRMLQRDSNNIKAKAQQVALHENEYQVMEQIRILKKQIFVPDPENLRAEIDFFEWEFAWVEAEITALQASNHSKKGRLLYELGNQKNDLKFSISSLKIREVRTRFPSFKQSDPPSDDSALVSSLLVMINEDEGKLRQITNTPEGKAVHEEILRRQKAVRQTFNQLELAHYKNTLGSLNFQPDRNDRASLVDYLNKLDMDIQRLNQPNASDVARNLRRQLIDIRNATAKQFKNIDKVSHGSTGPGFLTIFFASVAAAITAIVAGITLLFKRASAQIVDAGLVQKNNLETARTSNSELLVEPVPSSERNKPVKFISLGCLFWLLIFTGFLFLGFVAFGLVNEEVMSSNASMMMLLFLALVGFVFGARTFLRRTASTIIIKGMAGIPNLVIHPKQPGNGIQSLRTVQRWVGWITAISVIVIFFILSNIFLEKLTGIGVLTIIVGIALGPIVSRQVAKRTSMSDSIGTE